MHDPNSHAYSFRSIQPNPHVPLDAVSTLIGPPTDPLTKLNFTLVDAQFSSS